MIFHSRNATLIAVLLLSLVPCNGSANESEDTKKTLKVLFIGNSYTARHQLASIVEALAEEADPNLDFQPTQVIYGGRTLDDHWRFGTQHVVNRSMVTPDEVEATIRSLEADISKDPDDRYAPRAIQQMRSFLNEMKSGALDRSEWDCVVLQSYRDDLEGEESRYVKAVPRYVALAEAQGAQVLLYETTPTTQNQAPLKKAIDEEAVIQKSRVIGGLAKREAVKVAPMSYVAMTCQRTRPEFTLRFENDAHLNQTMAYLTACTLYGALFDRSPEGLNLDSVTDIRYWKNDRSTGKDRDGKPITRVFSKPDRDFLQAMSWKALNEHREKF